MSCSIWTQCGGASNQQTIAVAAWRVVEAQHQLSTRKLVDSAEEQMLLEDMLEESKPRDVTDGRLHYLLSTPFRYPPLRHGSRFGTRYERGIWYGAERLATAFAEVGYYRFVFAEGTRASLGIIISQLTAFRIAARSTQGIDLTASPFDAHTAAISSPENYGASQVLGAAMREAGTELCRYVSARDPGAGANVAVFAPGAFGRAKPREFETWHLTSTPASVEFIKRDYFKRTLFQYDRDVFLVNGTLPAPAV